MTRGDFLKRVRAAIGNPPQRAVSNSQLETYGLAALTWMAAKLGYAPATAERMVELEEDVPNYGMPADVSRVTHVNVPGVGPLTAGSFFAWNRDGNDYLNAESGTPLQYAFEGRELWLDVPPSSDYLDNLDSAFLQIRYQSTGAGLTLAGVPQLPDADLTLAILDAAIRWLSDNITAEGAKDRLGAHQLTLKRELDTAQTRHALPIEEHQPGFRVHTSRFGAAR